MKVLYWNVKGLCKREAREELKALCVRHRPDYMCIYEPKFWFNSVPTGYWDSLQLVFVIAKDRGPNMLPSI